ncbi:MAG: hypothetical protein K0Q91_41 [Fibrobacteria bacterium]|jgi:hypothetical protein|nr:hypothetical protein [Fibrobacteria bacterium]
MKFVPALCMGLLLSASLSFAKKKAPSPVKPPEPTLTQEDVGRRALTGILRGVPTDSLKHYFEDSVRASLNDENLKGFAEQVTWLSRFIGDSLDQFMTGTQVVDSTGRTAFFREYRFATETNRRAPLIVMHLYFKDSTSLEIAGAYNKTFEGDTRNRIADAQVWNTPAGDIDVHSVSYVEFSTGILPVIRVHDEADTTTLDSALAAAKGGPIVREAIARGHLAAIKAAKPGATFLNRFGVAFIRKDPRYGYGQLSFALAPESYGGASDAELEKKKAAAKPTSKKAAPAKKKTTTSKKK